MNYIASLIMPAVILIVIFNSILNKEKTFDNFIMGAADGINVCIKILPVLIGFVTAVSMLKASGFFTVIEGLTSPVLYKLGFPPQLLTLALLRPVSGSGSLAVLKDVLDSYGADSFIGRCASIIMSSTETTFYTLALYFGVTKSAPDSRTIKSAVIADITAVAVSIITVKLLF